MPRGSAFGHENRRPARSAAAKEIAKCRMGIWSDEVFWAERGRSHFPSAVESSPMSWLRERALVQHFTAAQAGSRRGSTRVDVDHGADVRPRHRSRPLGCGRALRAGPLGVPPETRVPPTGRARRVVLAEPRALHRRPHPQGRDVRGGGDALVHRRDRRRERDHRRVRLRHCGRRHRAGEGGGRGAARRRAARFAGGHPSGREG